MDEMKAAIEARIAALQQQQAQAVAQVNAIAGGIHELQQLLSGFDEPTETVIVNRVEANGISQEGLAEAIHDGLTRNKREAA